MPKYEFDFGDPMELNGVALLCQQDTTDAMAECFIEEFARLGYNHKQLLALFRNPHYLGMNMVLQNRGEPYVRECIAEYFARRGKAVDWPALGAPASLPTATSPPDVPGRDAGADGRSKPAAETEWDPNLTDPVGGAIPKLNL